jgi:hypothetical protein
MFIDLLTLLIYYIFKILGLTCLCYIIYKTIVSVYNAKKVK